MGRRVCLVTTGQPSTNPRLVKEADALANSGHSVHVIGARRAQWADESDRDLLASRSWTCQIVDHRRATGVRHRFARLAAGLRLSNHMLGAALNPVVPDLMAAALASPADLYIAHNLGALPAAATAAARHGARLGFDAEDFHSGQFVDARSADAKLTRRAEARFLPRCDYVTASSPGIAGEYAAVTGGRPPVVILNVFPSADRPEDSQRIVRKPGPWRLYWFSQTIGRDRGLEDVVVALGRLADLDIELHLRGEWQAGYEDRLRSVGRMAGIRPDQLVAHPPAAAEQMVRLAAEHDLGLALEPGHTRNNDLALSNKLFTYLLAGVPVLATATTGQQALAFALGEAARTVPPGDVPALSAAIREWLTDPQALVAARQCAWLVGTRRFNWDLEQQKFLSVVERTLDGRPAGALSLSPEIAT